ncbi:MAG: hypothetical protein ACON4Z_14195 [Planctomycetota bacterium]
MNAPSDPRDPDEDEEPGPGVLLAVGAVVYGALAAAALLWLWARGRSDALAAQSVGDHGLVASSLVGLGVGVLGAFALTRVTRALKAVGDLLSDVQRMFFDASDAQCAAFAVLSAASEELFFRLAVQDQFGLLGSVAAYVLLNSNVGGLRWVLFSTAHAIVFGLLVQQGFGLLGSTTAHAILTYLCLRRPLTP